MAEKRHRTHFDITATDRASQVFKTVEGGLASLHGKYLALGAVSAAVLGAGSFIADATRYRAALDDIADTTGDNIRTLDGMARQARVSGLELSRFGDILTLVARNMNAADDEGTAAAQAIEAIGLSVQELRALRPAEQMHAIAGAMEKFADGQGKIAVANALARGSARELLPFLKDLAEQGGVVGTITAEQAAQAERLEKEWRKLKIAFEDGKDSLVSSLIPALGNAIEQMREGIRVAGGFGNAIRLFGLMSPGGSLGQSIADKQAELEAWRGAGALGRFFQKPFGATYAGTEGDIQKQIEFLQFMQRQEALSGRTGPEFLDARDLAARQKPLLNFVPSKGKPAEEKSQRLSLEKIAQMQFAAEEDFREQTEKWRREQIEDTKKFNDELQKSAEHFRDMIDPLRKFSAEWEKLDVLLRHGAISQEEYLDAYVKVADAADKARLEIEGMDKAAKDSKNAFAEMGFVATSALEEIIVKGGRARDVILALLQDLARMVLRRKVLDPLAAGVGSALDRIFATPDRASTGDFSAGGGFEGVDWASVGGFATGGSFTVPGRGATDSQMVVFRATPGEQVDVRTPGQRAGVPAIVVHQHNNFAVGIRGEVRAEIAMQLPSIAAASRAAVRDARERGA
jgi:hypothetical protein